MSASTAVHDSFTLERRYPAAPARVYDAWSDIDAKAQWFTAPPDQCRIVERTFDFRVGGEGTLKGQWTSGLASSFASRYFDIVPNERIVYAYVMHLDDRKISVSLATVEFKPDGSGTRLVVTEQGVFFDGYDDAGSRERGTGDLLDGLGRALAA